MRRPTRARVLGVLPSWLVEKVPRDHMEPDEAFGRRRRVVTGVTAAGAALLGEPVTPRLLVALATVCLGLVLVNRR